MRNAFVVLLVLISLFGGYGIGFWQGAYEKTIPDSTDYVIHEILIKNDSLSQANDSITNRIKEIEKTYETTVTDILGNDVHDDYNFFNDYLRRYNSINNFGSVKAN